MRKWKGGRLGWGKVGTEQGKGVIVWVERGVYGHLLWLVKADSIKILYLYLQTQGRISGLGSWVQNGRCYFSS